MKSIRKKLKELRTARKMTQEEIEPSDVGDVVISDNKNKKNSLRFLAIFLLVFSICFGGYHSSGFCLGDYIFQLIGLRVWSNGTEGWHYPGVIAIIMLLGACVLYSITTENKLKTLRNILIGLMVLSFISLFIF